MEKDKLIIDAPKLQSGTQRTFGAILRALLWVLYLYLLLPLGTLLVWLAGWLTLDEKLLATEYWKQLIDWLPTYAKTVALLSSALIIWSLIQWHRFRGRERRKSPLGLSPREVAQTLKVDLVELRSILISRRLVAHHDSDGDVDRFETSLQAPRDSQRSGQSPRPASEQPPNQER
ncbi:MAG: poly-beta-1,6-N-acetyl-D-glucosamine biosynthesis protein PgaD [Casimicrobiaceae bacterium]